MKIYSVFISHSSKDSAIANQICGYLEGNGVKCWIAPRDITPGAAYPSEITRGIKLCDVFLIVLTEQSVHSPHVNTETDIAFNAGKTIIPFFADKVSLGNSMSYYLARKQWILGYEDYDKSMMLLLDTLKTKQGKEYVMDNTDEEGPRQSQPPTPPLLSPNRNTGIKNDKPKFSAVYKNKGCLISITLCLAVVLVFPFMFNQHSESPSPDCSSPSEDTEIEMIPDKTNSNENVNIHENQIEDIIFSETTIDNQLTEASWQILNKHKQLSIKAILSKIGNLTNTHCSLYIYKRSVEGVIENNNGQHIGYFEGLISSANGTSFNITGDLFIKKNDGSYDYVQHKLSAMIKCSEQISDALIHEMTNDD
ncbi:MAG: toll/interleukin-1 receptor domain-containing protein [Muribaculaceae bacterium]|nr:toll/interleukin-1 receptor domain-containing protein [Muribaculaceae bacterium]